METPVGGFEHFCEFITTLYDDAYMPVSISVAGVTYPSTGLVTSANIPRLSGRQVLSNLSSHLNRDAYLINNSDAFALAEAKFGKATDHDIVLAIILSTGMDDSIVIKGSIVTGANGTAGEWGHSATSAIRTVYELPPEGCN